MIKFDAKQCFCICVVGLCLKHEMVKWPNGTRSESQCGIHVLVRVTLTIRVFINIFSWSATCFYRKGKIFALNFLTGKCLLDGQIRQAKLSSQPVNLPGAWPLMLLLLGANHRRASHNY